MQQPLPRRPGEFAFADGKEGQRDRRRQGEPRPGHEPAGQAGPHQPDGEADLAARRPGQELAERDEVGETALVEPLPLCDEFVAEIAEMGDRAAKARQPEAEENSEDFERRAAVAARGGGD